MILRSPDPYTDAKGRARLTMREHESRRIYRQQHRDQRVAGISRRL